MNLPESLGIASALMGGAALVRYWRGRRHAGAPSVHSPSHAETLDVGEHLVLDGPAVIRVCRCSALVASLQIQLGMPPEVFEQSVRPLIDAYAGFVQCLSASSVQADTPVLVLVQALRSVHAALERRRHQILPLGAAPEDIAALAHRWSYALMVVALIEVAREALGNIAVTYRTSDHSLHRRWEPAAGALADHNALVYRVERETQGSVSACVLGFTLLHRCVPPATLAWLGEDPQVFACLNAVLARQPSPDATLLLSLLGSRTIAPSREGAPARDEAHATGIERAVKPPPGKMMLEPVGPWPMGAHPPDADTTRFLRWLKDALSEGQLGVNVPDALVHGVDGGLLLVTPAIFYAYAKSQAADPVRALTFSETSERIRAMQRGVARAGAMTDAPTKTVLGLRDRGGVLRRIDGIVLRDPERFGIERPAINTGLAPMGAQTA